MKRNEKDRRTCRAYKKWKWDQYLRQLGRERRELWNQLREAPIRELEEPYQRGWERFFVISEEAKRRKDSDRLRAVLEIVQNYQRSKTKAFFKYKHWKSRRRKNRGHGLRKFSARALLLKRIPDELLQYFETQNRKAISPRIRLRELVMSGWGGCLFVRNPHYFQRVIQPYMITHERVALPEVERRLAEVEAIICSPENDGRLWRIQGGSYRGRKWRHFDEKLQERKLTRLIMREIDEEIIEIFRRPLVNELFEEGAPTPFVEKDEGWNRCLPRVLSLVQEQTPGGGEWSCDFSFGLNAVFVFPMLRNYG